MNDVIAIVRDLVAALEASKRKHFILEEDCWYSCPKSGQCCNDDADETRCNCGADRDNAVIDNALAKVREKLAVAIA